jgi:hypothetical protein
MQTRRLCSLLSLVIFLLVPVAGRAQANPAAQAPPKPAFKASSVLTDNTLFTVYGRAFNRAPILGRLGQYRGFADMEKDVRPWVQGIQKRHDKKAAIPAIHLIYGMATPCKDSKDCLLYLDGGKMDIVSSYIEPAAKRGWMIVLDTQIGSSTPALQVKRMIDKGYLKYENVAVAIDPEFHLYPGRAKPGTPIGVIQASQVNEAQQLLDDYVKTQKLQNKKVLIVHQFGDAVVDDGVPFMIKDKQNVKTYDNVELVFDMDGLGGRAVKVIKYNKITDGSVYPFIKFRGIKVFFRNRWEKHGHYDRPPLSLDELFGIKKVKGAPKMEPKPDVIIIA